MCTTDDCQSYNCDDYDEETDKTLFQFNAPGASLCVRRVRMPARGNIQTV